MRVVPDHAPSPGVVALIDIGCEARPMWPSRRGAPLPRKTPGLAALAPDALRRTDGALVAALGLGAAAPASRESSSAEGRLVALRAIVGALDAPAQLIVDLAPGGAPAFRRRHATATAGEVDPRLGRLAADLRRAAGGWARADAGAELALTLVLGQPAPAAASGAILDDQASAALAERCARLIDALAGAGLRAERLAGADLLAAIRRALRAGRLPIAPPAFLAEAELDGV